MNNAIIEAQNEAEAQNVQAQGIESQIIRKFHAFAEHVIGTFFQAYVVAVTFRHFLHAVGAFQKRKQHG